MSEREENEQSHISVIQGKEDCLIERLRRSQRSVDEYDPLQECEENVIVVEPAETSQDDHNSDEDTHDSDGNVVLVLNSHPADGGGDGRRDVDIQGDQEVITQKREREGVKNENETNFGSDPERSMKFELLSSRSIAYFLYFFYCSVMRPVLLNYFFEC